MSDPSILFDAVMDGNLSEVRVLLDNNPDLVNVRNASDISLLMWAAYNKQTDILQYLREKKSSLDIYEATALGEIQVVENLLHKDKDLVNDYSPDGFTPLGYAAFFGYPELASTLLSYGARVNVFSKNIMQVYPIHSAVANRNHDIAYKITRLLLSHKANVNVKQRGGWTPLHQAAAHGNQKLVKLLLEHGADRNAKSDDGQSPFDLAEENGHEEILQILKSHK
ncbi:MAG TPA: ankyrin repeat domain-containing protein [Balneolales bacterium]|nr:ankyrin repeat domain-containing protein [Balneolales bacterium]